MLSFAEIKELAVRIGYGTTGIYSCRVLNEKGMEVLQRKESRNIWIMDPRTLSDLFNLHLADADNTRHVELDVDLMTEIDAGSMVDTDWIQVHHGITDFDGDYLGSLTFFLWDDFDGGAS